MTLKHSVIKGYHAFEIRPPMTTPPTLLNVEPEYTNIKDESACLVWIPPLDLFTRDQHLMTTDEKRQLKLEDVAGLPIGHAPRSLAPHFRFVLDNGGEVFAEVTKEPIPSFSPWPEPKAEGGGVVLPCDYMILSPCKDVFKTISDTLNTIPEGSAMDLVMC